MSGQDIWHVMGREVLHVWCRISGMFSLIDVGYQACMGHEDWHVVLYRWSPSLQGLPCDTCPQSSLSQVTSRVHDHFMF